MAAIAGLGDVAAKWARVTPQRSEDYRMGVTSPRKDWGRSTLAAADAWKSGIQAAIAAGSFSKGVTAAGTGGWQSGAVTKGVERWGPGVAIAEDKYQAGFAPYHRAIEQVQLPPRYARRDPRNLERVKAIVDALKRVKEGQR